MLAQGKNPAQTKAGELGKGKPVTIGADDSVEEALETVKSHKIRRLPVIDGHDLVGIVSQADVATNLPEDRVGNVVEAISAAPGAYPARPSASGAAGNRASAKCYPAASGSARSIGIGS